MMSSASDSDRTSSARVIVIGGGSSGLATAAELGRRGIPAVVLERGDAVGTSWAGRYDRLRLNSSRPFTRLPRGRWPRGSAMFAGRREVVRYLSDYAERHRIDVRPHTVVDRIDRDDRRIEVVAGVVALDEDGVVLADGKRIEPDAVIAATGYRRGLERMAGHLGMLSGRGVPIARREAAAPGLRFVG